MNMQSLQKRVTLISFTMGYSSVVSFLEANYNANKQGDIRSYLDFEVAMGLAVDPTQD